MGSWSLSTYWMMLGIGIIGMLVLMRHRKERYGLNSVYAILFTLLLTVSGIAGTKLLYILENLKDTLKNGISLGGMSFFGAVFLIPVLMILFGKVFSMEPGAATDACAPCVLIMIALMRIGCFLSGCCGGWEVELLGFHFHWPTQAMESIGDFGILGELLQNEERGETCGKLYPMFMVRYGILRFFIEFLRDTEKNILFMSNGQWFALTAILVGTVWIRAHMRAKE